MLYLSATWLQNYSSHSAVQWRKESERKREREEKVRKKTSPTKHAMSSDRSDVTNHL